jgi:peptide/nickel transport system permease protein
MGASIIVGYIVLFFFGSSLAPYRATELAGPSLVPPGGDFRLGTNLLGQDVYSQLVLGARASLLVALLGGVGTVLLGGIVGVIAGWFPGWPSAVLMRITDLILVLPKLPLLLLVGALIGGSVVGLAVVISSLFWPTTARILRSQVLTLRTRAHVRAATGSSVPLLVGAIPYRIGESMFSEADQRRFCAASGWRPAVELGEGLAATVEVFSKGARKDG